MVGFRKYGGEHITDLGEYIRNYLTTNLKINPHSEIKIYVGTDSEQYRNFTRYATVVVLYHVRNGAHYVYKDEKVKRVKEIHQRLWNEVLRTFEIAEYLETELAGVYKRLEPDKKLVDVDVDLNPSPKWKSNAVFDQGVGFLAGAGYRVKWKNDSFASSSAADLVCRKRRRSRKRKVA